MSDDHHHHHHPCCGVSTNLKDYFLTRRQFLNRVGMGFGGLSLAALLDPLDLVAAPDAALGADGLVVHLREHRLRVPSVHVRRRALGEDVDDGLGLAGKLRGVREEEVAAGAGRGGGIGKGGQRVDDGSEAESAEAQADAAQKLAAGEEVVLGVRGDAATGVAGVLVIVGHD